MQMSNEELGARLPPFTVELVLHTVGLEVQRDQWGSIWCRDRGVGLHRRKLGRTPTEPSPPEFSSPIAIVRDQARAVLGALCQECRFKHCKMKVF